MYIIIVFKWIDLRLGELYRIIESLYFNRTRSWAIYRNAKNLQLHIKSFFEIYIWGAFLLWDLLHSAWQDDRVIVWIDGGCREANTCCWRPVQCRCRSIPIGTICRVQECGTVFLPRGCCWVRPLRLIRALLSSLQGVGCTSKWQQWVGNRCYQ